MDKFADEVRREPSLMMMFADDFVISCESREQVKKSLEMWRDALERTMRCHSHKSIEARLNTACV